MGTALHNDQWLCTVKDFGCLHLICHEGSQNGCQALDDLSRQGLCLLTAVTRSDSRRGYVVRSQDVLVQGILHLCVNTTVGWVWVYI